MRKSFVWFICLPVLILASHPTYAVQGSADLNEYFIVPVEETTAGKVWALSYAAGESPIVITMSETKKGKVYVVRAHHFEVAYVSGKKTFGARKVNISEQRVPAEYTDSVINRSELARQRILTPRSVDDDLAIELIASYLPDLINPSYRHLLTKIF
ncbi:hypothetical protein [Gaoshiqia sp. Z1-71]|uniref:hypothetical protein n=1 Tax=Gaoshiqia hydrogeniformans TaxID=3290090 RepID=UPI003BF8BEB9